MKASKQAFLSDSGSIQLSKKVLHIEISVRDLDDSIEFYQALTGGKLLFIDSGFGEGVSKGVNVPDASLRVAVLQLDNILLELTEYENPRGRDFDLQNNDIGCMHIAFEVPDIQKVYARLKAKKIEFNAEPYMLTEADGFSDFAGAKFAYFRDPDGIQIELIEAPKS